MKIAFTDRELDVMTVLWKMESATVTEVRSKLQARLAYTTVLTVLRTLEEKGYVKHEDEGRAHRYVPTVGREAAGTSALRRLLSTVFADSPKLLLTNLVSDQKLSRAEIDDLRKILDDVKPQRRSK
jgi:predicted transcriptional regulator